MPNSGISVGDTITNDFEAYTVLEHIYDGASTTVFRVVCKSGRLRNRQLALKQMRAQQSSQLLPSKVSSLHQALHHPNIVSVLSAFSGPHGNFCVLELCSLGNLGDFLLSRPSRKLSEAEVRGVAKGLVDALVYLKKELVIHRNMNLSTVLLTGDFGVKLSGFEFAVRLASPDSKVSSLCGPASFAAPEMLSGLSYGHSVDIWSFGCIIYACLTNALVDAASEAYRDDVFARISLPEGSSGEVNELIKGILQIKPEKRLPLSTIACHPFISNQTPMIALRRTHFDKDANHPSSENELSSNSSEARGKFKHSLQISQSTLSVADTSRESGAGRILPRKGYLSEEFRSFGLRTRLSDQRFLRQTLHTGPRRVASDPIPRIASCLGQTSDSTANKTKESSEVGSSPMTVVDTEENIKLLEIRDALQGWGIYAPENQKREGLETTEEPLKRSRVRTPPIGTTRPVQFNTRSLKPQAHKTTYGHITILSSHSVLVDFRESQRRRCLAGNEVLVIDPDGSKIAIYSAPHLSSPSCLIEPTRTFSLETLPNVYWKQYNDVTRFIEQLKERTPKLIVHTPVAKCILMANDPQGDIEILFRSIPSVSGSMKGLNSWNPSLRLRLTRQNSLIEIARYVSSNRGEEWIKKTMSSTNEEPYIAPGDWKKLEQVEQEAFEALTGFVRICDATKGLLDEMQLAHSPEKDSSHVIGLSKVANVPESHQIQKHPKTSIGGTLSTLDFPPRPRITSVTYPECSTGEGDTSMALMTSSKENELSTKAACSGLGFSRLGNELELTSNWSDIKTRFIPSVGWCVRYGSRVSQGGRYQMMFLDGVALEIDVDEDWAEFKSPTGETAILRIDECCLKKDIGDKMKVFEEFVSMFDEMQE